MPNITSLLKYSLKTNIVKSILFEIISNTSKYFYTFGQSLIWPDVVGQRGASVFTVERNSGVVRITTRTPHGLLKNDKIIVSLNNITELNNPAASSSKSIETIERFSDIVTLTTTVDHNLSVGDSIQVESNITSINGVFLITEVDENDGTFLRYYNPGGDISLTTSEDINGQIKIYTAFTVLDVLSDISFTYSKLGNNILQTQEVGRVYSIERQVISSESDPPSVSDSYAYELEVRNNILFMKLIDSNDAAIVIPRINWQPGIIYDMYDEYSGDRLSYSGATSLANSQFYVLTDEFNVYKCIYNNNDQPSSEMPRSTSPYSEELTLSDGYIWKFMYTIPISLRNKFLTSEYMPVLSALSNQFYSNGSISNYNIVDPGAGYISNTYSVKSINIVEQGSGYLALSGQQENIFNISKISRTSNKLKIELDGNHGISSNKLGALSVSYGQSQIEIAGTIVTLSSGIKIIDSIGLDYFIVDEPGVDFDVIENFSGSVELTGAYLEFTTPILGQVQPSAYISEYGPGGSIKTITITEQGSGYIVPPTVNIITLNGSVPSVQALTNIVYNIESGVLGRTEIFVQGDGYNANNPYSLKRVLLNSKGAFLTQLSGTLFTFPEPDLPLGRKPQVNVIFSSPTSKSYSVIEAGRLDDVVTIAVNNENGFIVLQVGDTISVSNLTTYTEFNGTHTITDIITSNNISYISFQLAGADNTSVSETGSISSAELFYEVDSVEVIDEGYGYSKPLKFGIDETGNYFTVLANSLTSSGFDCSLDENNQTNHAVILPLIENGEIKNLRIVEAGVGYTYAFITVRGYIKENNEEVLMNANLEDYPSFRAASIQVQFSVGDIDSKQSTVEILAKSGSISCIKVDNGGSGYPDNTRIVVVGDGQGCQAKPEIVGGVIRKITLLNAGSGYTTAEAFIYGELQPGQDPQSESFNSGVGAVIRPILSPKGGHGRDAMAELFAKSIYLTSRLSNEKNKGVVTKSSNKEFSTPNDYRQITILKNVFSYGTREFYKKNLGSSCILISVDSTNLNNIAAYNNINQDDILHYSVNLNLTKRFVVIEKEEDVINQTFFFVLQPIDNYIIEVNSVLFKTINNNTYSIVASSIETPDFDKFSGEMLYINNRSGFTPSEEQTIVVSTLINF